MIGWVSMREGCDGRIGVLVLEDAIEEDWSNRSMVDFNKPGCACVIGV